LIKKRNEKREKSDGVEPRWFLVSSSAGVCMSLVWEQVNDL